jgi:drug/metabolite transporter (DMT)-like permease
VTLNRASNADGLTPAPPIPPRSMPSQRVVRAAGTKAHIPAASASVLLYSLLSLPAVADEAVQPAADAATEAAIGPLGYAGTLLPVALYGTFYLYREKVNPRAKISDFLFIIGALVVLGNIVSMVVFKTRYF